MIGPELRTPTDEDLDAILDLVQLSFGEGRVPRTREYWSWKHLANPFGRSYLLVAQTRDAIVGLRAFMRWTWWSAGRPVPAVRAVDTVTHPDWRGRGLFTRLTLAMVERVRAEGLAFVFNTPNKHSRPGYLKMGWTVVGRLTPWVWPRLLHRRSRRRQEGAGNRLASVGELLDAPGLDDLLTAVGPDDVRLATWPDRTYLTWRYAEAPGLPYRGAWWFDEHGSAALVFHVIERPRRTELRLCEILVGPTRDSAQWARRLIAEAARQVDADYVTALTAPGTHERRVVRGGGFLPLARMGPVLTVRPLRTGVAAVDPQRRRSWRPSAGSLELF